MNAQERFWVRFYSRWTKKLTIHSFDTIKEAKWFAQQVNGEVYDYNYNIVFNHGFEMK